MLVTTSVDPAELESALGDMWVTQTYRQALYGFAARLTREQIQKLQFLAEVESIGADERVYTTIDNATRWTGVTT